MTRTCAAPGKKPLPLPKVVTFASLNVNGIRSKCELVRHHAEEDGWWVFGLLETLSPSPRSPCVGPFHTHVSIRTDRPGERGVILAVRKGLRSAVYYMDPNFIIASVTISSDSCGTWFFAAVYVPCVRVAADARNDALRRLGAACHVLLLRHPPRPLTTRERNGNNA